MSHRRLTLALAVVVAPVALLAGCGGGGHDQKANDAYASHVCTATGDWLTEIRSVDALPPLSEVTKAWMDARLNHFETATGQFVSQIRALPAPHTSEGRAAKKKIDQSPLIPGAQGEIASARTIVATLAANGSKTQVVGELAALPDFRTLKATAQSTLASLQSGGGSLASAFMTEPACKRLG